MEQTRDPGRTEVWYESLRHSLVRRDKLPRSWPKLYRLRPERDRSSVDISEESPVRPRDRRRAAARRSFVPVPGLGVGAVSAVALLAVTATPQSLAATHRLPPKPRPQDSPLVWPRAPANEYVNPLARASVTPERIDQGVDYAGTGTLTSIGWARIIYIGTKNTGWPGAFIEYRLLHGSRAGRYVYYAEGITPSRGMYVGRVVRPGRAIAHLIPGWPTGIEIGWGANIGTETLAHKFGQYSYPTRCGRNFSAFIASLGGPPGNASSRAGDPLKEGEQPYGRP